MDFLQTTSDLVPRKRETYKALQIPIACMVNPQISIDLNKTQFDNGEIVRCIFCKGFINKYCDINKEEWQWRCNLCRYTNKITLGYSKKLNFPRIELTEKNFEIYADEAYMPRPPMSPLYFFLIDISYSSSSSLFLNTICNTITWVLTTFTFPERAQMGFILFDDEIHLVRIVPTTCIVTITDNDIWVPWPNEYFIVNIQDNIQKLLAAVDAIKKIGGRESTHFRQALLACEKLMKNLGGTIFCFLCNHYAEAGHPKELTLSPLTDFYTNLSEEFCEKIMTFNLFITGMAYLGLGTIGDLCKNTGGEVYYYNDLNPDCLSNDLWKSLTKHRGWEAGLKLRCSEDWKVLKSYGNFIHKSDVYIFGDINDQSYTFELVPKFEIPSNNNFNLQASILYTNSEGIRVIRILNLQLNLSDSLDELILLINTDVLLAFFIKQAASLIIKRNILLSGQKYFEFRTVDIIRVCLKTLGSIPDNLKDFISKALCLIKHPLFINNNIPCKCK